MKNKKSDDGYRSTTDDYISMGSNTYETYFKDKTFTAKRVSYPSSTVSDYRNMSNVQLKLEPYFNYVSATDLSTYVLKFYWPSSDNWLNFSLSINFSPSLDPPIIYY